MVILETNIIIDHLRRKGAGDSILSEIAKGQPKETLALSVISLQELYEGQSTRDEKKEEALLATISPLKILPYTCETAKRAGEIARDLNRPLELADAAIAATALINQADLLTLNKKAFTGIDGLNLYA